MSCAPNCPCTPDMVDLAFRDSEPYIDREIADRSYQMRRYLMDYAPVKIFPDGIGYNMTKVRFWGDIGPQFDGFEGWRAEERSRPTASGLSQATDACGHIWEEVGHGFEELAWHLMKRDLRTIPICIEDIRTFWEFQQYQNLIFKNLADISANMREQLNRNALIGFSVKNVPTAAGLQINSANPYALPNILGVTVGRANFATYKRLYSALIREAGTFALDTIDGRPVFGVMGTDETLDDVTYQDAEIRQDLRWSSMVDSLLKRYNFMDSWRGQFVLIPDNDAPRYNVDELGNLIRIFPYERNVPIQSGTRPAPNPDYDKAPYELLITLTRDVFALRSRKAITSVGGETDFNAVTGLFEWKWHNPERWCDPTRSMGYYWAKGRLGVEPGDFTDIPGVLVQRRPVALDTAYWPAAICPDDPVDCDNVLPTQGCPCPQIIGCCEDFTDSQNLQFRFNAPIPATGLPFTAKIDLNTGGVATVSIIARSADLMSATADFGQDVVCDPSLYVQLHCTDSDICSSKVITDFCELGGEGGTIHTVTTENPLAPFIPDDTMIVAVLSDGTFADFTIHGPENVNEAENQYTGTLDGELAEGVCIEALCLTPDAVRECPGCPNDPVTCADGLPD